MSIEQHGLAKRAGKYKGRQVKRIDDQKFQERYNQYMKRIISKTQLAKELEISRPTLDKLLKDKELMK